MEPEGRHAYCITTVFDPEQLITNDDDEVLVFDTEQQLLEWFTENKLIVDNFLVHEVEVLEEK